ncbi:MAG: group 1 glycosyl transferase, partial [Bacteroidia bacterium]|nr:group 1 glycosyl transferase [Bacteroidia bacterium]
MPRKVLILIDWYLPGYKAGGPIQSCVNIVKHFKDEFDFRVVTSDRDLGDEEAYASVTVDEWNILDDETKVFYFSPEAQQLVRLLRIIKEVDPDVIYMNSMFSKFFTLYPLLLSKMRLVKSKMVVAPRGMLGKGALAIKAAKKESFLKTAKLLQ